MESNGRAHVTVRYLRRVGINNQGQDHSGEVNLPVSVLRDNFHSDVISIQVGRDEQNSVNPLKCLWPVFFFYRILGLCPISKRGNRLIAPTTFLSPYWLPTLLIIVCQVIYFINYFLKLTHGKAEEAGSSVEIVLYLIYIAQAFANTVFAIWKIKLLPKLLAACRQAEAVCEEYGSKMPPGLVRKCVVLFCILEFAHILSMVLFYWSFGIQCNVTSVENYFERLNNDYLRNLTGSLYTGIILSISEIIPYAGWNYGEVLLSLLSLILTSYFLRIHKVMQGSKRTFSSSAFENLRRGHLQLCEMVQVCDDIFSPLFLTTYLANVGFLFARLYLTLQDDFETSNEIVIIESIYAICYQLVIRIFLPSLLAAQLYQKVQDGWKIIRLWEPSLFGADIDSKLAAIESYILQSGNSVGVSGWGYFMFTKSFISTLSSVIFTYEVIIIQFQISIN